MNGVPDWIQVLQALLTPAIAIGVGVIAFMQWRTAHQKVVLDLFDRRLAVYDAVMEHYRSYRSSATPDGAIKKLARSLRRLERKAAFLFGDDVVRLIDEFTTTLWKVLPYLSQFAREDDRAKQDKLLAAGQEIERALANWDERFSAACLPYMRMNQKQILSLSEWLAERNKIRLSYADEKQQ